MGHNEANGAEQTVNIVSKYSAAGKADDYIGLQMSDNNGESKFYSFTTKLHSD